MENSIGGQFMALWRSGLAGQGFVVLGGLAIALLLFLRVRTRSLLGLNTAEFMKQIDKLVSARVADRAIKLSCFHDGPVARMTRLGLEAAQAKGGATDPAERARHVTEQMERALPEMMARVTMGNLPARILGGLGLALGVAALLGPARQAAWLGIAGIMAILAVAIAGTVLEERRYRSDLQSVIATVTGPLKVAALRTDL